MGKHANSPPDIAAARILALRDVARQISIKTGGDPAEAIFELICAAILICHEARPAKMPEAMIAQAAPDAAATVEAWFQDELKDMRCRHG